MFKIPCAAALALLLAACVGRPAGPPAEAPVVSPPGPKVSGATRYRLDPALSELRILVYRAGAMAALGHNHVIVNRALSGWASLAGGVPPSASFSLTMPTCGFVVDEAGPRAEEGADFSEPVPDDAKTGTLHNMLGPAVLDAAEFPDITVQGDAVFDSQAMFEARVALKVAGHESTLAVPFTLTDAGGRLTASGSLTVRQTAIGLVPLSVFLGALRVQDEMRVKFKFVATVDQGSDSDTSKIEVPSGAVNTAAGR